MKRTHIAAAIGALVICQSASAVALITNGGFEAGLSGWTVTDQAGGSGTFYATGSMAAPSGVPTVGPFAGLGYALSDQSGPGAHSLRQAFNVQAGASSIILSFQMFINNYGGFTAINNTFDYNVVPSQFARVDLLTSNSGAFDLGSAVLQNFFIGSTGEFAVVNPYIEYTFDITSLLAGGGDFQLRFAETDNAGNFSMGLDNVGIEAVFQQAGAAPEPGSLALLGLGLAGLAAMRMRKQA